MFNNIKYQKHVSIYFQQFIYDLVLIPLHINVNAEETCDYLRDGESEADRYAFKNNCFYNILI